MKLSKIKLNTIHYYHWLFGVLFLTILRFFWSGLAVVIGLFILFFWSSKFDEIVDWWMRFGVFASSWRVSEVGDPAKLSPGFEIECWDSPIIFEADSIELTRGGEFGIMFSS